MNNADKAKVRQFVAEMRKDVCTGPDQVTIANNGRVSYRASMWQGRKVKPEVRHYGFADEILMWASK